MFAKCEGFRTPAPVVRGDLIMGRHPKTFTEAVAINSAPHYPLERVGSVRVRGDAAIVTPNLYLQFWVQLNSQSIQKKMRSCSTRILTHKWLRKFTNKMWA
jgi:hypothetical protein